MNLTQRCVSCGTWCDHKALSCGKCGNLLPAAERATCGPDMNEVDPLQQEGNRHERRKAKALRRKIDR